MSSPQIRRKARARALEYLYGLELTGYPWDQNLEKFWEKHATKASVQEYATTLIEGVAGHREELDTAIREALTNWSWDRVDPVERSVLRIALFEMGYRDDVPPPVAINEAIELTKRYAPDESPRFVNGVLDRLKSAHLPRE